MFPGRRVAATLGDGVVVVHGDLPSSCWRENPRALSIYMAHQRFTLADPQAPELDAFSSGNDEVDRYFKARGWIKAGKYSPATYEIRTGIGSAVVGYAAYAFKNMPHVDALESDKGRYLVIYALGLSERF